MEELREASNHLYYEVGMLTSTASGIASGVAGQGPIANALRESFTIHVRAVMDFLYANGPHEDDVIAEDFFGSTEEWSKLRPALSGLLSKTKHRVGKEVAHLSYARLDVTAEKKSWPFIQIADEISQVINIFLKAVPEHKLGAQWKRA